MADVSNSSHHPEDIVMTVRNVVILTAAAGLLLAAGHTAAQAPPVEPAGQDPGKRLESLEQKMDRVLRLLEGRGPAGPPPQVSEKTLELIQQARETLTQKVEAQQQAYQEFRLKNPFTMFGRQGGANPYAKRLERDDARLQELRERQAEVTARMGLVKNVGESEKGARALLVLLQRRGVDLPALRQSAGQEAGPVDLVRLYAASLRLEAEELQQMVATAEEQSERDQKVAREMNMYEVEEEKFRMNLDQSRELLKTIVKRLQEITLMKDHGTKP
jgi:hypothetical protein